MSTRDSSAPKAAGASRTTAIFAILAVATASFSMLQSLLNPVLPVIQRDLDTTQAAATWILTAWLLSAAVTTPLLGRTGDMVGKKRALMVVLAAVALGSLTCALAPTIGWMLIGRVIQGLGGAVYPLAFGIIRDEFPSARVPSAIGLMSGVIAVGGGIGTVLAGPIVDALGWRWLFWIPLIVVLMTVIAATAIVPESPVRQGGRINWVAGLLLAGWLVALLLPLSQGAIWGWSSWYVVALFALACALFVAWAVVETITANPLVDLRMMRLPIVWPTNLVALLFGAGMFAVLAFVPQFTQTPTNTGYGLGASVTESGLIVLPMLVTMAIAGAVSGAITSRLTFKGQLTLSSIFGAVGTAGFAVLHSSGAVIAVSCAIFGLGLGMAYAAMTSLIVQGVPTHQTGVATGMNANIRNIGGALGTAVVSAIVTSTVVAPHVDGSVGAAVTYPSEAGYTMGFLALTVIGSVAAVVSQLIPSQTRSTIGPIVADQALYVVPSEGR